MARAASILSPAVWPTWLGLSLLRLLVLLPHRWQMVLGRGLGAVLQRLAARRRRIVERNLELCFPQLDPPARQRLRDAHFANVGMALFEFGIAWWWSPRRLAPLCRVEGREHLEAARQAPGGLILISAHFSALEIGGRILTTLMPVHAMYRRNENPAIERLLQRYRSRYGSSLIPRDNPRPMLKALRAGEAVWYGPDQNYRGKNRVFADFFGHPAATHPGTSRMAAITHSRVLPVVCLRDAQGYRLIIGEMLEDFPSSDQVADARRINALVEDWVHQAPEQYNWLHRRFKTQPDGAPSPYD